MTVDVRCTVVTDQGISLSGSLSDEHVDATNALVKVRGTITFQGIRNLTRGTAVNLAYSVPGYNEITRFPRRLRVLSSKVDPFQEETVAEVGCLLTLKADLKPPETLQASSVPPAWQQALPSNMQSTVPTAIYASAVLAHCLTQLGITAAAGNQALTSAFLREEFDLSAGYVQVINDLLASESCFGYLNEAEQLVVQRVVTTTATGPVLTRDDLLTMEGIEGGAPAADQIRVVWDGAVQAPPQLQPNPIPVLPILDGVDGELVLTEEQQDEYDDVVALISGNNGLSTNTGRLVFSEALRRSGVVAFAGAAQPTQQQFSNAVVLAPQIAQTYAQQQTAVEQYEQQQEDTPGGVLRDWTYEESVSTPKTYVVQFLKLVNNQYVDAVETVSFSPKSTTTTTFQDLAYVDAQGVRRTESVVQKRETATDNRVGPANPTRWKSKASNNSPTRASDPVTFRSVTTYEYEATVNGIRTRRELISEYEPVIAFASGLGIQNWVLIDLGFEEVLASQTETLYEVDDVADRTKTSVSRWLAWGKTQEGAQGLATVAKELEGLADEERVPRIYALVDYAKELIFDGTETRISIGRGSIQSRGTAQSRAQDQLTRDPVTGVAPGVSEGSSVIDFDSGSLPGGTAASTGTFRLPYATDDVYEATADGEVTVVPEIVRGDVEEQARRFGEMQNYLTYGHSNGVAITTEIRNLPSAPLAPIFIQAAGIAAAFRANGTSWAWGEEGMIVGTDALLIGTAGTYEQPEFSDSWVPVPVTVSLLPVAPATTTNANPRPANTITLPNGFDPTNPGSLWSSLPTGGTDVPPRQTTSTRLLEPRNQRIRLKAKSRSKVVVRSFDYPLTLPADTVRIVSRTKAIEPTVALPATVLTVTTPTPALVVDLRLPLTTLAIEPLAPAVTVGGVRVDLPLTTLTVEALAPEVVTIGAVDLPLSTLTVEALAPTVEAVVPSDFFGGWAGQNAPWVSDVLDDSWWGS